MLRKLSILNAACHSLHKKIKFPIKNLFSKCDQIHRKLRIWSRLQMKFLIENLIFLDSVWNFPNILRIQILISRALFTTLGKLTCQLGAYRNVKEILQRLFCNQGLHSCCNIPYSCRNDIRQDVPTTKHSIFNYSM